MLILCHRDRVREKTKRGKVNKDAFDRLLEDPEKLINTICANVASGGSLINLCEVWGVGFGLVSSWIRSIGEYSERYESALKDRNEWTKERVLSELRRIGLSNIKRIYDSEGNLVPVQDWPDDVAAFVSKVEHHPEEKGGGIKNVTFWNKEKALELIGKNISMFIDRVDHSGNMTLEDLITQSRGEDE